MKLADQDSSEQPPLAQATATAARLRLLATELAGRSEAERNAAIAAVVEEAAVGIPAAARGRFLDQLLEQFPAWGQVVLQPQPASGGGPTAQQWNEPAALIAQLAALAGREPQRRREILARLQPLVGAGASDSTLRRLQQQLAMSERTAVDPNRAMELTLLLIDFVRRLEQFTNGVWNTIGGKNAGAAPRPIAEAFGQFLNGANASSSAGEHTKAELDAAIVTLDRRIRVLMATLRAFSRQHAEKFAPSEIESAADIGIFGNKAKACWEKYIQLCGGEERDALEAEIGAMYVSIISRMYLEHRQ